MKECLDWLSLNAPDHVNKTIAMFAQTTESSIDKVDKLLELNDLQNKLNRKLISLIYSIMRNEVTPEEAILLSSVDMENIKEVSMAFASDTQIENLLLEASSKFEEGDDESST
jgi:hypothetical protein